MVEGRQDVQGARGALADPGCSLADAPEYVPNAPGLYAIHGGTEPWRALRLGEPPDTRPLYVGKAERSLVSRDLRTHFGAGRTGSSTIRRSFAALLRKELGLCAQPRNLTRPKRLANFALAADGDDRLTTWMHRELTLAIWLKPSGVTLIDVERQLLALWKPPLNLRDVATPWSAQVSAARKAMADEARAWARERGFEVER